MKGWHMGHRGGVLWARAPGGPGHCNATFIQPTRDGNPPPRDSQIMIQLWMVVGQALLVWTAFSLALAALWVIVREYYDVK